MPDLIRLSKCQQSLGAAGVLDRMRSACETATACKPLRVLQGHRAPKPEIGPLHRSANRSIAGMVQT